MNRLEATDALSRLTRKSLEALLSVWEKFSGTQLTYNARPTRASDIALRSESCPNLPPFALVMQGPLLRENDFTLESLALYRRTFPNAKLILSTWQNEDAAYLKKFRSLEIDIVQSPKPENPGQQNINYQLVSARAGMLRAAELGAHYAMKSRTDQRMYGINIQPQLMDMLAAFPLKRESKQRQRIIAASLATLRYRMYGVTDMTLFGHIDDMLLYWSAPHTTHRVLPESNHNTWREVAMERICEVYLATEFLTAVGRKIEWTLADSWHAFADHFCIIDAEHLDIYWPKYTRFRERRFLDYSVHRSRDLLTFPQWLQFYTGSAFEREVPEWILDVPDQRMERPS